MHSNLSSTETIAHHENMPSFTNSFENSMKNTKKYFDAKSLKIVIRFIFVERSEKPNFFVR